MLTKEYVNSIIPIVPIGIIGNKRKERKYVYKYSKQFKDGYYVHG